MSITGNGEEGGVKQCQHSRVVNENCRLALVGNAMTKSAWDSTRKRRWAGSRNAWAWMVDRMTEQTLYFVQLYCEFEAIGALGGWWVAWGFGGRIF